MDANKIAPELFPGEFEWVEPMHPRGLADIEPQLLRLARTQHTLERRLKRLQTTRRPTDEDRDEAWLLLRSLLTLTGHMRRLRKELMQVRLG